MATKMEYQYRLHTFDGREIACYADDEIEALDKVNKSWPDEAVVHIRLHQVRMVKN